MKKIRSVLRLALVAALFVLLLAAPALADYDMWVESYYEFSVAEAAPGKEIGDYYLFEGECRGLDFYITGDGKNLMLYGAPLIPGEYYYSIQYVHTDGTAEYVGFWINSQPTEVPETEYAPEAAPLSTPVPDVTITKHPTGETVAPGGTALFIARADYDSEIAWCVVSPDGTVYEAQYADNELSGLGISGLGTETLTLSNIPKEMNGWSVECWFVGQNGVSVATTNRAKITVTAPAAAAAPTAAPSAAPTEAPETPVPTEAGQTAAKPVISDRTEETGKTEAERETKKPEPTPKPLPEEPEESSGGEKSLPDRDEEPGTVGMAVVIALSAVGGALLAAVVVLAVLLAKKGRSGR